MKGVSVVLVAVAFLVTSLQMAGGQEEGTATAAGMQLKLEPDLVTVVRDRPSTFHAQGGRSLDEVLGEGIQNYLIKGPETLMELAYAYDLGFNEVVLANPQTDEWMPPPDSVVKLATQWIMPEALVRMGDLVVNVPEMRLYHKFNGGRSVETFPVGVGREGWETPYISTNIIGKKADPTWHVPKSILKEKPFLPAFVPPGPENPLGTHAIYLASGDYRIHGTNQPLGVGRRVSHGCMRLYPEDIITLFGNIQVGSKAHLVNEPVKAGWKGDLLYLEVHPSLEGDDNLRALAVRAINRAMERNPDRMVMPDWRLVEQLVRTPDGLPHQISLPNRNPSATSNTKAEELTSSALREHLPPVQTSVM